MKDKVYAYDINYDLINLYKHIQNYQKELYKYMKVLIDEYDSLDKPKTIEETKISKESYYYWIRNRYNQICKNTIECFCYLYVFK